MDRTNATEATGAVSGGVRILLRLEGFALLVGMTVLYADFGGSWLGYVLLFPAPDLSFAGYLVGRRTGAIVYNAAHSYFGPLALIIAGLGAHISGKSLAWRSKVLVCAM